MEENKEYKLIYNSNGGIGGPEIETSVGHGDFAVFTVSDVTPYRQGYLFSGWSKTIDGEARLSVGDSFVAWNKEMTLYAVWTKAEEEFSVVSEAVEEHAEPLGVISSSPGSSDSGLGFGVGMAFIFGAILLGIIALVVFRAREPKILSMEEVKDE